MTELQPPGFLQNAGATHTAQEMRVYAGGLIDNWPFRVNSMPAHSRPFFFGVRTSLPGGMVVRCSAGIVYVSGTENTTQGVYTCYNDANKDLTVAAADPTLNRIDIVIARVRDTQYSGGTNNWTLEIVTGTPAGSPTQPTAPANSAILTVLTVNAGVTVPTQNSNPSSTTAKWTNSVGGFELVASKALYDFQGSPLQVHDYILDEYWFQDDSANWRRILTQLIADMGAAAMTEYTGVATIYTGTAEAVVSNMTTSTVTSPIGRRFIGTARLRCQSSVAGDRVKIRVRLDSAAGTLVAEHNVYCPQAATDVPVEMSYMYSGGGSHVMVITAARDAGTGTVSISGGGGNNKFYHIVSDMGSFDRTLFITA